MILAPLDPETDSREDGSALCIPAGHYKLYFLLSHQKKSNTNSQPNHLLAVWPERSEAIMSSPTIVQPDTSYTVPLLINGKEVVTKTTFAVISPATQKQVWNSSTASLDDVKSAVSAAKAAFPAWSKMKPAARRNIFLQAANVVDARTDELADYMKIETGAVDAFSKGFNVPKMAEMLRDVAGRLTAVMGHIPSCEEEGTSALIVKEPYGVVLGIAPWYVSR